jgi:hypothetical protein
VTIGRDQSGERAYPTAVEDELAVGLVGSDGLFGKTCGARVKFEDVGGHGSTEGSGGGSEGFKREFGGRC